MTKYLCWLVFLLSPALVPAQDAPPLYFGADLSYVNEMEDCGGVYRENGQARDPFDLFAAHGANLVRVRLWHSPDWTAYSTFADVRKTIQRAKAAGMETLLDFHYSDEWADPGKQIVPAAWAGLAVDVLADSLYRYTFDVLSALAAEDLLPEMVQVGNEINPGLLLPHGSTSNWAQLGTLLNAGIRAIRDVEAGAGHRVKVMLHVAQPENVLPWVADAISDGGVTDFDAIGLSYYKNWSYIPLDQLADYVSRLVTAYGREVIVVETAYPWTLGGHDSAGNILGGDALEAGYPATPEAQHRYLIDLSQAIFDGGGTGLVFWEPAWISTGCSTRWGQGSHWENVALFDFNDGNEVLPAIDYMRHTYRPPRTVETTLRVDMTGRGTAQGVFLAGDMTYDASGGWRLLPMADQGDGWYAATLALRPGVAYRFRFYDGPGQAGNGEPLSVACAGFGGEHRLLHVPEAGGTLDFRFGQCAAEALVDVTLQVDMSGINAPNGVYLAGDLTRNAAAQWTFKKLDPAGGNVFTTTLTLARGGRYPFAFYTGTAWRADEKEQVPHLCATAWGTHRTLTPPDADAVLRFTYGRCEVVQATGVESDETPEDMGALLPNYPNPFRDTTTLAYSLTQPQYVTLAVYDLLGRRVAVVDEGLRLPAIHQVRFDAGALADGVYLYRLDAGGQVASRPMLVLK